MDSDQRAIDDVVRVFFDAFTSGPGLDERMAALQELFLPGAVIVRTCGLEPLAYNVDGFIAPRHELLAGGSLTDFREWQLTGRTEIFGDIAQHVCSYAKQWRQGGDLITGRGMKTISLVRTGGSWLISAAAWDDERDGLTLDPSWSA